MLTPEQAEEVINVFQMLWPVFTPWLWWQNRKIERLEQVLKNHEQQRAVCQTHVAGLDERIKHTLTPPQLNSELEKIYNLIRLNVENQAYMKAQLEALTKLTDRIDQYLRHTDE